MTRLHRSEVRALCSKLALGCGIEIRPRHIEAAVGYPLREAGIPELTLIIATLRAVYEAGTEALAAKEPSDAA